MYDYHFKMSPIGIVLSSFIGGFLLHRIIRYGPDTLVQIEKSRTASAISRCEKAEKEAAESKTVRAKRKRKAAPRRKRALR